MKLYLTVVVICHCWETCLTFAIRMVSTSFQCPDGLLIVTNNDERFVMTLAGNVTSSITPIHVLNNVNVNVSRVTGRWL